MAFRRGRGSVAIGNVDDRTLVRTGLIGAGIAAICCVTPVLAIPLGLLGLSAWLGWLDYVLIPALLTFLGIAGLGWGHRRWRAACCEVEGHDQEQG